MKKQLFLLRHAKSSWDDPSLADHDRPLSKRGRKAAAVIRQWLRQEGIGPDLVYVSGALRTRQTLAALEPGDKAPEVEVREDLYLASAPQMIALLGEAPKAARAILVIGHNPGLQELAVLLAGEDTENALAGRMAEAFPTGALAAFEIDGPWARIGAGAGKPVVFVKPRELK